MEASSHKPRDRHDLLLMGAFALLYLLNRSPFLGWNDALGFMADAAQGFSPYTNATSHFLYTNLLHVLTTVFGFLDPALVGTLFSVLCSLVVLWRIPAVAALLVPAEVSPWAGRAVALALGMAFTFWQQSEGVEVYAFNNLIFVHFLWLALRDLRASSAAHWWQVALLLGLALLTHVQAILALPFFLYYLVALKGLAWGKKMAALMVTGALFSVLLWVPLIARTNSLSAVFFDNRFQDAVLGFDVLDILKGAAKGMAYFAYNFHIFGLLILWGWWRLWRTRHPLLLPMLVLLLPYLAFALKYSVNDNHVFYLVPYLVLVLPLGMVLHEIWSRGRLRPSPWLLLWMLLPIGLYAGTTLALRQTSFGQAYGQEKAYKGGVVHLCWPGKAWAKDPLALAQKLQAEDPQAFARGEVEWNYPDALRYLEAVRP